MLRPIYLVAAKIMPPALSKVKHGMGPVDGRHFRSFGRVPQQDRQLVLDTGTQVASVDGHPQYFALARNSYKDWVWSFTSDSTAHVFAAIVEVPSSADAIIVAVVHFDPKAEIQGVNHVHPYLGMIRLLAMFANQPDAVRQPGLDLQAEISAEDPGKCICMYLLWR